MNRKKYFCSIWVDGNHHLVTNLASWKAAQQIAEASYFALYPLYDVGTMFNRSGNQHSRAGWQHAHEVRSITIGVIDATFEY